MLKNKLKRVGARIAIGALAVGAVTGGVQAVEAATAPSAQAYSYKNCRVVDAGYGYSVGGSGYRYAKFCEKTGISFWEWTAGHREGQLVIVRYGHTWSQAWGF